MIHIIYFQHDNINQVLGVCLEAPNTCILMQYAERASIQDIIASENVKLSWDIKTSLLTDIVEGMKYLHSTLIG